MRGRLPRGHKRYERMLAIALRVADEEYDIVNLNWEDVRLIDKLLAEVLTEKEVEIIKRKYGLRKKQAVSFRKIGQELGISASRAHQLHNRALLKIRKSGKFNRFSRTYLWVDLLCAFGELEAYKKEWEKHKKICLILKREEVISSEEIGFSRRAFLALWRNKIEKVGELEGKSKQDLMKLEGIGEKTAEEIIWKVKRFLKGGE